MRMRPDDPSAHTVAFTAGRRDGARFEKHGDEEETWKPNPDSLISVYIWTNPFPYFTTQVWHSPTIVPLGSDARVAGEGSGGGRRWACLFEELNDLEVLVLAIDRRSFVAEELLLVDGCAGRRWQCNSGAAARGGGCRALF